MGVVKGVFECIEDKKIDWVYIYLRNNLLNKNIGKRYLLGDIGLFCVHIDNVIL